MKKIFFSIAILLFTTGLSFSQKYAYIDSEYIMDNIPEYKDAQSEIDALSKQWQKEIEQKFKEIDNLYKAFQAESVLLPEEVKKKRENEIIASEKDAKDLQKKRFGKDGDLYKKRQDLVKPIQDKVYNAIEKRSQEKNYIFVFDKAGSLTIMYADPKYDMSDDILNDLGYKLNKTEKSEKTKTDSAKPNQTTPTNRNPNQKIGGRK
ncbi:MAG: OmpH family outer membrane protein [Bacteroidetes bacterium]|nr:OmpH family outer membrane protein [Bacteroidota bacterium]